MFTSSSLNTFVHDSRNVYIDKTVRDDAKNRDDKTNREDKIIYDEKSIRTNKKVSRTKQRKVMHKINKFWVYDNFYDNSFSIQSLMQY